MAWAILTFEKRDGLKRGGEPRQTLGEPTAPVAVIYPQLCNGSQF